MNDNNQAIDTAVNKHKVSGTRRLLVKGAVGAAPAVLTLRSGTAFALNSAEMCVPSVQKYAAEEQPFVLSDNNDDAYHRIPVDCRTLSNGDVVYKDPTSSGEWIKGNIASGDDAPPLIYKFVEAVNDVEATDDVAATDNTPFIQGTPFIPGTPAGMVKKESEKPQVYTFDSTETWYVLAHANETGSLTGEVGDAEMSGGALPFITTSCWASATPAP